MNPDFIGPHICMPLRVIDFPGFYESNLSYRLDSAEEQEVEYIVQDKQDEEGIPPELRVDDEFVANLLYRHADYGAMREEMAEAWTDALDNLLSEFLGVPAGIHFHSLWSPREYNYRTDELTVWIPVPTARNLMIRSMADNHTMLEAVIKDQFTDRSGFLSNYSNRLQDWLKPLADYDDIELGALLDAVSRIGRDPHDDSLAREVTGSCIEICESYAIVSNNINWAEVDKAIAEKREELAEEIRANQDPDYVPPTPRCPLTIDMFRDWRAAA